MDERREEREELDAIERDLWEPDRDDDERDRMRVEQAQEQQATTFDCPNCGDESFPDEVGSVRCGECGTIIETVEQAQEQR